MWKPCTHRIWFCSPLLIFKWNCPYVNVAIILTLSSCLASSVCLRTHWELQGKRCLVADHWDLLDYLVGSDWTLYLLWNTQNMRLLCSNFMSILIKRKLQWQSNNFQEIFIKSWNIGNLGRKETGLFKTIVNLTVYQSLTPHQIC